MDIRAFRTAIPLTGHGRSDLREMFKRRIEELRAEHAAGRTEIPRTAADRAQLEKLGY